MILGFCEQIVPKGFIFPYANAIAIGIAQLDRVVNVVFHITINDDQSL